uniref:Expressed conserved protein n=1 Tax=Echinococcus granulosus TaxID=6210 RepID=A0A068WT95_ECHGR|nr:hypothetical protein EgrG_002040500 [Echinococcus granulosus]
MSNSRYSGHITTSGLESAVTQFSGDYTLPSLVDFVATTAVAYVILVFSFFPHFLPLNKHIAISTAKVENHICHACEMILLFRHSNSDADEQQCLGRSNSSSIVGAVSILVCMVPAAIVNAFLCLTACKFSLVVLSRYPVI